MVISTDIAHGIYNLSMLNITLPFIQTMSMTEFLKAGLNVYMYQSTLGERNVKHISWLQGYTATIISGSAGSVTVAILRGAPIDILHKTDFWLIYGLWYYVFFHYPITFNSVHQLFMKFPVTKLALVGLAGINKGYTLFQVGVDKEKEVIAKVICGVLVSCGGALCFEVLGLGQVDWKFTTPRQFLSPSINVKISLWTIACYLIMTVFIDNRDEAHAIGSVIFALLLVHNTHKCIRDQNNKNDTTNMKSHENNKHK